MISRGQAVHPGDRVEVTDKARTGGRQIDDLSWAELTVIVHDVEDAKAPAVGELVAQRS
jgi:hypothetical protein